MRTGTIFDIKEFAVHDGPGVRQTVFLKGCPLRCQWCHNPEGLAPYPQLMYSRQSCTHCEQCSAVCPRNGKPCTVCGRCVEVCPLGLRQISGRTVTSHELVRELRKNSGYYEELGGGVTFSGGEPLMQSDFLLEVLEQIKDLHTAIETSAFASPEIFHPVVSRLSLVIIDIKLVNAEAHKRYTGVDNAPILENLAWLCRGSKPFVVRIPLIPGVNDSSENLEATARLVAGVGSLLRVELLPYHKTAGAKYEMLGKPYRPDFNTDAAVCSSMNVFEQYGIRSEVL